jgi:esterase/lipase superfamily enzyme
MPPPTLYSAGLATPFAHTDEALRTAEVDVLYVTDRTPQPTEDGRPRYGIGRSASIAFGSAVVHIGDNTSWEQLETVAQGEPRALELDLYSVSEIARAPPTPLPWILVDGQPVTDPVMQARNQEVLNTFCNELARRMSRTRRKEAFVYVHGVQNTFADSVFTIAELWHYLGREGVPLVFSWPAGYSGILRGYTYDRESSEFAVFHVKQFFYALAQCPTVERISIVAHSRGTDVTLSALRELTIRERAAGRDPLHTLHLNNVVLAAPDLDLGVTAQRVAAERVVASARRWTIYQHGAGPSTPPPATRPSRSPRCCSAGCCASVSSTS